MIIAVHTWCFVKHGLRGLFSTQEVHETFLEKGKIGKAVNGHIMSHDCVH